MIAGMLTLATRGGPERDVCVTVAAPRQAEGEPRECPHPEAERAVHLCHGAGQHSATGEARTLTTDH